MTKKKETTSTEQKVKVKCPKCKHKFFSKSKLGLISCSNCGNKFKREENIIKEVKKNGAKKGD